MLRKKKNDIIQKSGSTQRRENIGKYESLYFFFFKYLRGRGGVQTMYTHVSKCKNAKIKNK
jgi:hypothetical protein